MTRLATLRKIPKAERAAELADAAGMFLPSIDDDERPLGSNRVLHEVESIFGVSPSPDLFSVGSYSLSAQVSKVQGALYNEIRDSVLNKDVLAKVRARLGTKGMLSPSQYDVAFPRDFEAHCGAANLTRRTIEGAIGSADDVEHLSVNFDGLIADEALSLFIKKHPTLKDCAILVLASRKLASLIVQGAWHVFYKLIGADKSERPFKIFEKFVRRYGVELDVPVEGDRKFIFNRPIPIRPGENPQIFTLPLGDRTDGFALFGGSNVPSTLVRCVIAYALDIDLFFKDMVSMGLRGEPKRPLA